MRAVLLASVFAIAGATAHAAPESLFAERTALLALDAKCDLLTAPERAALEASTAQARGALLRSGWSQTQAHGLAKRAAFAGAKRACTDAAVSKAVSNARAGYASWTRLHAMRFPGAHGAWSARRTPDLDGFLLRQDGHGSAFGIRETAGEGRLTLAMPLHTQASAPRTARLILRDVSKSAQSMADLRKSPAATLPDLAPLPAMQTALLPSLRTQARLDNPKRTLAVYEFTDTAAGLIAALDPREAIFIELDGTQGKRIYFEVGDFAAALAFLKAR
jgi:hypothetical protein